MDIVFRDRVKLLATSGHEGAILEEQPVRVGVPFARGIATDQEIYVQKDNGSPVQQQLRILSRWTDGSVRWALIEFCWHPSEQFEVVVSDRSSKLSDTSEDQSSELSLQISSDESLLLCHRQSSRKIPIFIRLSHNGTEFHGRIRSLEKQDVGPVRCSWTSQVEFTSKRVTSPLQGQLTLHTYSSNGVVEIEFCIRNPQAMDHPGGNWDLGAKGSVLIDELSVELEHGNQRNIADRFNESSASDHINFASWKELSSIPSVAAPARELRTIPATMQQESRFKLHLGEADEILTAVNELRIFQASSGGENWSSRNHADRDGNVPMAFCGYEILADGQLHRGKRVQPKLCVEGEEINCAAAFRQFWQNFPRTLAADKNRLRVGLFPRESGYPHELQGGEQKTHEFAFEIVSAGNPVSIDWYRQPIHVGLTPSDYALRHAIPYLTARSGDSDSRYECLVDQAIQGNDTFFSKREQIDEYGWRNFGDIYGDHESVYHDGKTPLISHYNNQYDCTAGFAQQYLRTGNVQWFRQMVEMADHSWDIDTYHTVHDKLLYNGGLFWHTYHYADADTSTHRSYPRRLLQTDKLQKGKDLAELGETGQKLATIYSVGGGPAPAHNYSTGWMIAFWLTGKQRYRDAAINSADYVLRVEDGQLTPFRWLCRSDTGHSTCSSAGYFGPGRAAANSTHALLTAHELTGNEEYLKRVAFLMRRTVHPQEGLDSLDLLNAELRWFYTMYLQALGRFVDYKVSLGQIDDDFRYGAASLLHYSNWMQQHERPTLSQLEQLQYPTETWAAQDMRKWHVLEHAAIYESDLGKRQALREKAEFFYNDVCETLGQFPTKTFCRPVAIILNFGWQRNWFLTNRDAIQAKHDIDCCFPKRSRFTPQREIAVRRFKLLALTLAITCATLVGACMYCFLQS